MSFLSAVTSNLIRAEQLRNAWNSLSYDILTQQNVMSPPLTPESTSLPSRLSPSVNQQQASAFEIGEGTVLTRPTTSVPAAFHTVRIKEVHPTMDHYANYVHVRGVSSNEQCSCCPLPVSTMLYNGSQNMGKPNSCMQHRSMFSNDITASDRLTSHLFNSARSLYQFTDTSTNSDINNNSNNIIINNNDNSSNNNTNNNTGNSTTSVVTTNTCTTDTTSNSATNQSSPLKRKIIDSDDSFTKKKMNQSSDEVACQVHGILSLPGCREPRYNITVSELQRRVNQPECLTKVDMISYVRLAKNSARSLLDKYGIKTNQHNQRSEHTVLSKMCESEAQVLAKGIREINYRYFPGNWFARKSVQEIAKVSTSLRQQHEALSERLKDNEITRCVLLDIYFGLEKRKEDEQMRVFNGISHSFGVPNMQNHILFLLSYIEEELRVLRNI